MASTTASDSQADLYKTSYAMLHMHCTEKLQLVKTKSLDEIQRLVQTGVQHFLTCLYSPAKDASEAEYADILASLFAAGVAVVFDLAMVQLQEVPPAAADILKNMLNQAEPVFNAQQAAAATLWLSRQAAFRTALDSAARAHEQVGGDDGQALRKDVVVSADGKISLPGQSASSSAQPASAGKKRARTTKQEDASPASEARTSKPLPVVQPDAVDLVEDSDSAAELLPTLGPGDVDITGLSVNTRRLIARQSADSKWRAMYTADKLGKVQDGRRVAPEYGLTDTDLLNLRLETTRSEHIMVSKRLNRCVIEHKADGKELYHGICLSHPEYRPAHFRGNLQDANEDGDHMHINYEWDPSKTLILTAQPSLETMKLFTSRKKAWELAKQRGEEYQHKVAPRTFSEAMLDKLEPAKNLELNTLLLAPVVETRVGSSSR